MIFENDSVCTEEPQKFALDLSLRKPEPRPISASVAVQTDQPSLDSDDQKVELESTKSMVHDCQSLVNVITTQIETDLAASEEESIKPEDAIELDRAELSHEWQDHSVPVIDLPQQSTSTISPDSDPPNANARIPSLPPASTLPLAICNVNVDINRTKTQAQSNSNSTATVTATANICDSRRAQWCQICGKVLAHLSSLYRHHRLAHNKNKHTQASQRVKDTKNGKTGYSYLKKGLTMMTLEDDGKPTVACNLCGESMSNLADLRRHKLTVHKLGTPAYAYDYGSLIDN